MMNSPAEVTAVLTTKLADLVRGSMPRQKRVNGLVMTEQSSTEHCKSCRSWWSPLSISSSRLAATARLALEDMQALTRQIQQRKERIRDLLDAYRQNPNQSLKNRILRNVKRLKQKMQALRERMAQLQQKLPEEFLNLDGLKGSKLSESMKDSAQKLDDLESMLEEGRIDDAMKALDDLSESLDAFDQLVAEDMETLHQESDPKRQQAISEMMDRTKDLINAQKELMKQTQRSKEKGEEAFKKAMENSARQELDKIAMDLVEAEREITKLQEEKPAAYRADRLKKLSENISKTLESLKTKILPRG